MPGDYLPDELKNLWQELATNPVPVPINEIRGEMDMLKKALGRRLLIGAAAVLIPAVAFALYLFMFPNFLMRIGSILTVAGAAYVACQVISYRSRLPDACDTECARFYRAELVRQRDFHQGWTFWSRLGFFLPGPLIFCVGLGQVFPDKAVYVWADCAALIVFAIVGVFLNSRLARRYQRRIELLD